MSAPTTPTAVPPAAQQSAHQESGQQEPERETLSLEAALPPAVSAEDQALALSRRRKRSIALGLVLAALVVLFYIMTFIKMAAQSGALHR